MQIVLKPIKIRKQEMKGEVDKDTMMRNYIRLGGQLKSDTMERWGEFKTTAIEERGDDRKRRSHNTTQTDTVEDGSGPKRHRKMRGRWMAKVQTTEFPRLHLGNSNNARGEPRNRPMNTEPRIRISKW